MAKKWTAADLPDLTGKTIVITGATAGLGLETAIELARVAARVVLAVRNEEKGARVEVPAIAEFPAASNAAGCAPRSSQPWGCSAPITESSWSFW